MPGWIYVNGLGFNTLGQQAGGERETVGVFLQVENLCRELRLIDWCLGNLLGAKHGGHSAVLVILAYLDELLVQ